MSEEYQNRPEDRWEYRRRRWEERKKRWEERRYRGNGDSHIWTGVFILLVGIAVLLRNTMDGVPEWVFSWPMFLIALGAFIGVKHKFKGGAWFIMMLIGGAFLINKIDPGISIRQYIWPGILILIGGMLILRPRKCRDRINESAEKKSTGKSDSDPTIVTDVKSGISDPSESQRDYKEDFVDNTSIFGGAKKNIISKNFRGGDLVNIFGGAEIDLTRADFKGTATIELTNIFGGTTLVVPSNWSVKSEAVTIFGGMDDKRSLQSATEDPDKTLLLRGTVIFGGIEIKSY